jgi:hypothetical protein
MSETWMHFREFYWAHREAFIAGGAALGFLCVQSVILIWALRRMSELSNIRERMARLADAMTLLTDTTEAGMSALAARLDAAANTTTQKPRALRPASRTTIAKRVAEAARKGERVTSIAERETLSESEVRLHLALSNRPQHTPPPAA